MTSPRQGGAPRRGHGGPRSEGITQIVADVFAPGYPNTPQVSASRGAELGHLLKAAVVRTAELVIASAFHQRGMWTTTERHFLADCAAGKRAPSDTTLRQLMALQSRSTATQHCLSEEIRLAEDVHNGTQTVCPFEASELETESNHPLNVAQLLFAREKSPIRALQVMETGRQQMFATRRLVDSAAIAARLS